MSPPPANLRIASLGVAIGHRRARALDVVEACLAQIDRFDPELKAWAHVDREGALARAAEIDRHGHAGPLAGVPLGVKDIVDVAGMPTRCGSELTPATPAPRDAELVARLRAAGAVILGKTATTQFAYLDPAETRNPWKPDHTPGGSSSGSAAAVAAGMCLGTIGTQTGGSLIRPAAYCGIAALKPSHGVVSCQGVFPLAPSLDHPGPMARDVRDLRALAAVLSEREVEAPESSRAPRLGWLCDAAPPKGWFCVGGMPRPTDEVHHVARAAFAELITLGVGYEETPAPEEFERVHEMYLRIISREAARSHDAVGYQPLGPYRPKIAELIDEGRRVTAEQEAEAREIRERFRRSLSERLEEVDALVLPATPSTAPAGLEKTGDPAFNAPWSFAGFPALTFPVGLSTAGLPVGLQFVGRWQGDGALLAAAEWCELALGFSAVAPPLQSAR